MKVKKILSNLVFGFVVILVLFLVIGFIWAIAIGGAMLTWDNREEIKSYLRDNYWWIILIISIGIILPWQLKRILKKEDKKK